MKSHASAVQMAVHFLQSSQLLPETGDHLQAAVAFREFDADVAKESRDPSEHRPFVFAAFVHAAVLTRSTGHPMARAPKKSREKSARGSEKRVDSSGNQLVARRNDPGPLKNKWF